METIANFWWPDASTLSNFTMGGLSRLGDSTSGVWDFAQGSAEMTLGDVFICGSTTGVPINPTQEAQARAFLAGR